MPQSTIRVVARLVAFPNKVEEAKALLLSLVPPTRQEAGFIQYDLLQNQSDPTDFTFVEEWESNESLDLHLASTHIQAAIARIPELIAEGPDIRRYTLIS
ncbi:MAG: antibiotic biosynthesis monooxygenase [Oscillatoriales cyanobacterium C42_A2020_001]|nr:antibiotic biosynthesis monooxygenase [Leptolyngbyaceae cyanobacterium C42_A2020_001]